MSNLTFDRQREANVERLPLFKNSKGAPAHSESDGSDWTPAQWVQALIGELGEMCGARMDLEKWHGSDNMEVPVQDELHANLGREVADVQTYHDITALRLLDITIYREVNPQPARVLMHAMAFIGQYANARKKWDRGDFDAEEYLTYARTSLSQAIGALTKLHEQCEFKDTALNIAHPTGLDLGDCTVAKFDEVSDRVGCDVKLGESAPTVKPEAEFSEAKD